MNETGELIEWNDNRGFGFVRARNGDRLFIHATALPTGVRRLEIGDRLLFARGQGRDGRPAVVAAQIAGFVQRRRPGPSDERIEMAQTSRMARVLAATILIAALLVLLSLGQLPSWGVYPYLVIGAVSSFAYWNDKRASEAGAWRTSEAELHVLDLAFGIVGGLLAQAAFRHKTAKRAFAVTTWTIFALHLAALALLGAGVPSLLLRATL